MMAVKMYHLIAALCAWTAFVLCTGITTQSDQGLCKGVTCPHRQNCSVSGKCHCFAGYNGTNCTDINECQDNHKDICWNRGTCNNFEGGYNCTCVSGWKGPHCTIKDDKVTNRTCMPGYKGDTCETLVACGHGNGKNASGRLWCSCHTGWTHRHENETCTIDVDECKTSICSNGNCSNTNGSYSCSCPIGWFGQNCSYYNACAQHNPCKNGGACITKQPSSNGYTCTCTGSWYGDNCTDNTTHTTQQSHLKTTGLETTDSPETAQLGSSAIPAIFSGISDLSSIFVTASTPSVAQTMSVYFSTSDKATESTLIQTLTGLNTHRASSVTRTYTLPRKVAPVSSNFTMHSTTKGVKSTQPSLSSNLTKQTLLVSSVVATSIKTNEMSEAPSTYSLTTSAPLHLHLSSTRSVSVNVNTMNIFPSSTQSSSYNTPILSTLYISPLVTLNLTTKYTVSPISPTLDSDTTHSINITPIFSSSGHFSSKIHPMLSSSRWASTIKPTQSTNTLHFSSSTYSVSANPKRLSLETSFTKHVNVQDRYSVYPETVLTNISPSTVEHSASTTSSKSITTSPYNKETSKLVSIPHYERVFNQTSSETVSRAPSTYSLTTTPHLHLHLSSTRTLSATSPTSVSDTIHSINTTPIFTSSGNFKSTTYPMVSSSSLTSAIKPTQSTNTMQLFSRTFSETANPKRLLLETSYTTNVQHSYSVYPETVLTNISPSTVEHSASITSSKLKQPITTPPYNTETSKLVSTPHYDKARQSSTTGIVSTPSETPDVHHVTTAPSTRTSTQTSSKRSTTTALYNIETSMLASTPHDGTAARESTKYIGSTPSQSPYLNHVTTPKSARTSTESSKTVLTNTSPSAIPHSASITPSPLKQSVTAAVYSTDTTTLVSTPHYDRTRESTTGISSTSSQRQDVHHVTKPTSVTSAPPSSNSKSGKNIPLAIGMSVGGAVIIIIAIVTFVLVFRKCMKSKVAPEGSSTSLNKTCVQRPDSATETVEINETVKVVIGHPAKH